MKDTPSYRVRLGVFEVDLRAGELRQGDGSILLLPEQPLQILRMLVEASGELVTRDKIQQKLWPNDTVVEFDHSINTAIKKLRRALGDSSDEPQYIETIAKRGYRLLVAVERIRGASGDDSSSGDVSRDHTVIVERMEPVTGGLIGKKVSHYRVLSVIGGGGMGLVYEAEDLKLGRRVALKVLPEELASDPVALRRFEREAQAASSLNHPNICTIYEVEEYERQSCIVMELLKGQTLRDWLASVHVEQKTIPLEQILGVAIQVADGLQVAHEKGIVHRDIKPANIFLTTSGQVKILDFGVVKLIEADKAVDAAQELAAAAAAGENVGAASTHLTRTGTALGTAAYMSPEQVRGEKLDARSDIFSFGLVLYEMATGERAFSGDTALVVQEAILNQAPVAVHERDANIPPKLEEIIDRAIAKDRERRYQSAAAMGADLQLLAHQEPEENQSSKISRWKWLAAAAMVCVAIAGAGLYWHSHRPPKLTERDTIVLADFDNRTGDPVFDDALKQALSNQLSQSPLLNLVSDRKVRRALKEMNRSANEPLTEDTTRAVCLHVDGKAMLAGAIAALGNGYIVKLKAMGCNMSNVLAEAQEHAPGKDAVLKALDEAAIAIRKDMGERLSSVEKNATPAAEIANSSLEAWKAYSMGVKADYEQGAVAAMPFHKRAIEIDPNFAMAYIALSFAYLNRSEPERAEEYARKAYQLRNKVSDRERFQIESTYYFQITGEMEKAANTYEQWQQSYPKDVTPHGNLDVIYSTLGNEEKALDESRATVRLEPNAGASYQNLVDDYQNLNRLDDVAVVLKQAEDRKLTSEGMLVHGYQLAFLRGDAAQMAQIAAAAMGKPGPEDALLSSQADAEGWYGRFASARKLTQRAMDSAQHNDAKETAALYKVDEALREVAAGNREQVRKDALAGLKLADNRQVKAMAALALAQVGEADTAEELAGEIDKARPVGTMAQHYWLPTIRAAVALERKDARRALELLSGMGTLELSANTGVFLYPAYLRGEAYLMLGDGKAAAGEFRKFVDHYGLVRNFPVGALARLGLARAYALEAATDAAASDKARTAYQNFLTLWKDADPDVPIYKKAKAEYAKLQ